MRRHYQRNLIAASIRKLRDVIICVALCVAACVGFVITFDVGAGTGVSSEPTIMDGDTIFSMKRFYSLEVEDFVCVNVETRKGMILVKRIVAEGGDHVVIKDGKLYINDDLDDRCEDYYYTTDLDIVVPEDHYFVLGDNRSMSYDSRMFGCVSRDDICGKVIWTGEPIWKQNKEDN